MKKVVFLILIFMISTSTGVMAQPDVSVSLNVQFMDSWAVYTMADWESNPNLYTITITNESPVTEVKYIFLQMEISVFGCADASIPDGSIGTAVTRALTLAPAQQLIFRNDDYFRRDIVQQEDYLSAFEDAITNTGNALPAGTYIYTFKLYLDYEGSQPIVPYFENAVWFNSIMATEEVVITQPNDPELISPGEATDEGISIYEANPVFQWLSSGAQSGARMYYKMIVCNKEEGQSNDEAIENLPFFIHDFETVSSVSNPPWINTAMGIPVVLNFPYPSSEENFTNGKFVWQVFVKSERNLTDPSSGFEGESEIYCFQYGDVPQPIYPPDEAEINNLTPSFTWTMAMGAQGYLIRLSGDDDPMVENNYFEEEVPATFVDHVPGNQVLVPDNMYYWKVRALPVGYWCQPVSFMVLAPGSGSGEGPELAVIVNPMGPQNPTFIWDMVDGASSYQLYVNDGPETTSSIWDFNTTLTSVIYPNDAPTLELGGNYYAWVQPLDDQGAPFGEPSAPNSFEIPEGSGISPTVVNLISPVSSSVYTTTPAFTWDPLSGAVNYGILIYTNADMSEILWTSMSVPSTSVTYPSGATPLTFGSTYYWQVVGINNMGEEMGDRSDLAGFNVVSVIPNLIYPAGDVLLDLLPNFTWEFIEGVSSFRVEVAADQGFANIIWSTDEVVTNSVGFPVAGVPALQFSQTYWWRVTALNEAGAPLGDPSAPASFTMPSANIILELLFGP